MNQSEYEAVNFFSNKKKFESNSGFIPWSQPMYIVECVHVLSPLPISITADDPTSDKINQEIYIHNNSGTLQENLSANTYKSMFSGYRSNMMETI